MLKSTRESTTSRTLVMASSGRLRLVSFILFQVFMLTGYASAQDFSRQFYRGLRAYGSHPTNQYPRSQYPRRQFAGPQVSGPQFPGPQAPGPQYPETQHPEPQYPEPQFPPFVSTPKPPGPPYAEDDLVCLVGTNLEVPYPLYKQISDSFLSSTNILVLCPNNTIVQVQGYAGLKDLTHDNPENTKVLISSEAMVPASIYLRIVLIQPEEIMIRLPDGQILPHQIFLEQYGKQPETHEHGGQLFFESVPPEDAFPFLVENEKEKQSESSNERPSPPFVPNFPRSAFPPEGDGSGLVPVPYEPWPHSAPKPHPQYPEPSYVPHHPEPVPIHHSRPNPVPHHQEVVPVPHHYRPQSAPQHAEPHYSSKPTRLDFGPAPYNFDQRPRQHHPRSAPFPLYSDHHQTAAWSYYPRSPQPRQVAKPIETQKPATEQKAFLPAGVHVIETSRCSICDPSSDDDGAHVTVFSV